MGLGDGVRRNIRNVSAEERRRFARALLALQNGGTDPYEGGAEYWFRRAQAYCLEHDHRGADFLPWHRELCNRLEDLIRQVDPDLSLHYWDWNEDPRDLFMSTFDVSSAEFGPPFGATLSVAQAWCGVAAPDTVILHAPTFARLNALLERKHAQARFVYFGGTVVNAYNSLHDPLALLLHANLDRLYAMWQARAGEAWRLDPARVYGLHGETLTDTFVEPWSTELMTRPWLTPAHPHVPKTFAHPSVIAPPCYDTLPARIVVDETANPQRLIRFRDVAVERTFARAAAFRIFGRGNLTFTVTEGPTGPYAVISPGACVRAVHSSTLYQEVRLWFGYTGDRPGTAAPEGHVTIRCEETQETFVFRLQANTVAQTGVGAGAHATGSHAKDRPGVTWTWTWRALAS
jgi:Common central domain of tyrosinase